MRLDEACRCADNENRLKRSLIEGLTPSQIARIEGRSLRHIKDRMAELGISRTKTDKEALRERLVGYLDASFPIRKIAQLEHRSKGRITDWIREFGLTEFNTTYRYRHPRYRAKLMELADRGLTLKEMGRELGYTGVSIAHHFAYHGLPNPRANPNGRIKYNEPMIKRQIEEGVTYHEIAKGMGVSSTSVGKYCKSKGMISSQVERSRRIAGYDNREALQGLITQGMCKGDIAKHLGVSFGTASKYLDKHGLEAGRGLKWGQPYGPTISVPCEHLKGILYHEGFTFTSEHPPLKERRFRIDIAFKKAKLGIEVNGTFHYADSKNEILSPRHQERHDLITKAGWTLIEIRYDRVWNGEYVASLIEDLRKRLGPEAIRDV